MKKSIQLIILIILCFITIGNAQNKVKGNGKVITEKRTTAAYDEIILSGSFDAILISGTEGEISIDGEENILPHIKVEVTGNVLKISNEKNIQIEPKKKLVLTVPFKKISSVTLSGSGDVISKSTIMTPTFKAKLSGSGNLILDVKSTDLEVNLSGSGDIVLKGNTDNFTSKTSGSGDVDAVNLIAKKSNVTISGSGNMKVNCTESLYARVSGSGDISYKGDPKTKDTKVSGSGEITKI